jgi:hypothetical protein
MLKAAAQITPIDVIAECLIADLLVTPFGVSPPLLHR